MTSDHYHHLPSLHPLYLPSTKLSSPLRLSRRLETTETSFRLRRDMRTGGRRRHRLTNRDGRPIARRRLSSRDLFREPNLGLLPRRRNDEDSRLRWIWPTSCVRADRDFRFRLPSARMGTESRWRRGQFQSKERLPAVGPSKADHESDSPRDGFATFLGRRRSLAGTRMGIRRVSNSPISCERVLQVQGRSKRPAPSRPRRLLVRLRRHDFVPTNDPHLLTSPTRFRRPPLQTGS